MSLDSIVGLVLPLVLGFVVRFLFELIQKAADPIDNLPPWAKQITVVLIAALLNGAGAYFGVSLCSSETCGGLSDVTQAGLSSVLTAIIAMVTHNGAKLKAARVQLGISRSARRAKAQGRPIQIED